jgi:hypothetical protein
MKSQTVRKGLGYELTYRDDANGRDKRNENRQKPRFRPTQSGRAPAAFA